jgi:hypothetical protein
MTTLFVLSENLGNRVGSTQHTPTDNFTRWHSCGQFVSACAHPAGSFLESSYDRPDRPARVAGAWDALVTPGQRRFDRRTALVRSLEWNRQSRVRSRPLRRSSRTLRRTRARRRDSGGWSRTRHSASRKWPAHQSEGPPKIAVLRFSAAIRSSRSLSAPARPLPR